MNDAEYIQIPIASALKPAEALPLFRHDQHPFALLGKWAGNSALLGSNPQTVRFGNDDVGQSGDNALSFLNFAGNSTNLLNRITLTSTKLGSSARRRSDGVFGGWVGYLGYPHESESSWWFGWYDHLLRFDTNLGWFFEAIVTPLRKALIETCLEQARERLSRSPGTTLLQPYALTAFATTPTPEEHQQNIEEAITQIRAQRLEHLNLTMRFEASIEGRLLDAFVLANTALTPPYAAYLAPTPTHEIASLSPEQFLARRDNTLTTKPIKGTRARIGDPDQDALAAKELLSSTKERDENHLVVDLAVGEFNEICEPNSVQVTKLFELEPHPGVWHLVSEVTGKLPAQIGNGDLLSACFPPASITGTPKDAALALIAELESKPRGIYTGAIGIVSPNTMAEWSVAIRTFEAINGRISLGVGGGLTAASDPIDETLECLIKARPLIEALNGSLEATSWPNHQQL